MSLRVFNRKPEALSAQEASAFLKELSNLKRSVASVGQEDDEVDVHRDRGPLVGGADSDPQCAAGDDAGVA